MTLAVGIMAVPHVIDAEKHISLQRYYGISGLIFDVIGAVFLWVDSQVVGETVSQKLYDLLGRVGIWQDHPIPIEIRNQFKSDLEESSKLSNRGIIFLVLGFLLQIMALG